MIKIFGTILAATAVSVSCFWPAPEPAPDNAAGANATVPVSANIPAELSRYLDDVTSVEEGRRIGLREAVNRISRPWADDHSMRVFSRMASSRSDLFATVNFDLEQPDPDSVFNGSLALRIPGETEDFNHLPFVFDRATGGTRVYVIGRWHNYHEWVVDKVGAMYVDEEPVASDDM